MSNLRLTDLIDIDRDIAPNGVTAIYAGVGAGKNSIVEGYHTDTVDYRGLSERKRVLLITSRKAKVNETISRNVFLLPDIRMADTIKWDLFEDKSVICTNANIQKRIQYDWSPSSDPFWMKFDYIVVDEFHSLVTDATFASSSFIVKRFLDEIYETCIEGRAIDEIKTKLLFMSATPEPAQKLIEKYNPTIIDKRKEALYIKPKTMRFTYTKLVLSKIKNTLKSGGRVIYYLCRFNNMDDLIQTALDAGIKQGEIAVSVSADEQNQKLKTEYPDIFFNKQIIENSLSEHECIPEQIKLFITNSKNKEGINIETTVDFIAIEDHSLTDVIQICGRMRNGIDTVEIVCDAEQHRIVDKYSNECDFQCNYAIRECNNYIDKLIQRYKLNPNKDNIYINDKIYEYIEYIEFSTKYVKFNPLKHRFEINECYIEAKRRYDYEMKKFDNLINQLKSGKRSFNSGYLKNINIEYDEINDKNEWIKDYFMKHEYRFNETVFEPSQREELINDLNEYRCNYPGEKNNRPYKQLGSLLKFYNCTITAYGKHDYGRFKIILNEPNKDAA